MIGCHALEESLLIKRRKHLVQAILDRAGGHDHGFLGEGRDDPLLDDSVRELACIGSVMVQSIGRPREVRLAPHQEIGSGAGFQGLGQQGGVVEVLDAVHGGHQCGWVAHYEFAGITCGNCIIECIDLRLEYRCLLGGQGSAAALIDEISKMLGNHARPE